MVDRPLMPLRSASAYSCCLVRPPGPEPERLPPLRLAEMSSWPSTLLPRLTGSCPLLVHGAGGDLLRRALRPAFVLLAGLDVLVLPLLLLVPGLLWHLSIPRSPRTTDAHARAQPCSCGPLGTYPFPTRRTGQAAHRPCCKESTNGPVSHAFAGGLLSRRRTARSVCHRRKRAVSRPTRRRPSGRWRRPGSRAARTSGLQQALRWPNGETVRTGDQIPDRMPRTDS